MNILFYHTKKGLSTEESLMQTVCLVVFSLDGSLEDVAHTKRKIGLPGQKSPICGYSIDLIK